MTSTMKSEPAGLSLRDSSGGVPTSAAATLAVGRNADGTRAGSIGLGAGAAKDVAGDAPCAVTAAPATAAPDRNLRRLTLGSPCRLAIENLPAGRPSGATAPRAHRIRWTDPVPNPLVITLRAAATLGLVTPAMRLLWARVDSCDTLRLDIGSHFLRRNGVYSGSSREQALPKNASDPLMECCPWH